MENETYCNVKKEKEYTEKVRRWNNETDASGSEMGEDIEKLLNNDAYLKEKISELEQTIAEIKKSSFVGTTEECNAADEAGEIPVGTFVYITDD